MTEAVHGRRTAVLTACVFAVATAVHAVAAWQYRLDPFFTNYIADAQAYDRWAQRIAAEGLGAQPSFHQAPLFPLLLSLVHAAVPGEAVRGAAIGLQILMGSAAVALLVPLARALFGSVSAGLAAAGLALAFGPLTFHALKLLPTPLAMVTQCAGMLLLVLARERRGLVLACAAGIVWGLACLTRAEMLAFAPIAAAAMLGTPGLPLGRRSRLCAAWLVGLVVTVAPATLHNLRRGESVLVASSGGENLWVGNQVGGNGGHTALDPRAGDIFSQRLAAEAIAESAAGRELGAAEVSSWWARRTMAEARMHPGPWIALELRKLARVLHPGEPTDLYSFALERDLYLPVLSPLVVSSWTLLVLACAGAVWSRSRFGVTWPLLALIATHMVVLLTFFVDSRLRLPLLFFTTPFGGVALVEGARRLARGPGRPAALVVAALAIAGVAVGAASTRAEPRDRVRLAAVLSTTGQFEPALAVLEPAIAGAKPDAVALDQAGWIEQQRGDLGAARSRYEEALSRGLPAGRQHQTLTRLAMLLEQSGEFDAARAHHDRAVASPQANAGTYFERGVFRLRRGDLAGAASDLHVASRLDPAWPAPRKALAAIGEP